jgi:hypothetical protein
MYGFGGKDRRKEIAMEPRCRLEDNIRMNLGEIGWDDVDWIYLAQDRDQWRVLISTVMNISSKTL